MISKIVAVSAVLALASAGIVPVSYQVPVAAVSSQSIVRHEQPHAIATPVTYHSAPVAIHAAPVPYHSAPANYGTHSALASQNIVRHASVAPIQYSAAASYPIHSAVSSQNIIRHGAVATVAATNVHYAAPARIAVAYAPIVHAAPARIIASHQEDYDAHPSYDFAYSVADGHTGDNKSQHETREGDVVHGEYSLVEADGSVHRVEYSADGHSGFNAVVSHSAPGRHSAPAPAITHAPVQILPHH